MCTGVGRCRPGSLFEEIEDKGKKSTFTKGFVTVEYTCPGCHDFSGREIVMSQQGPGRRQCEEHAHEVTLFGKTID